MPKRFIESPKDNAVDDYEKGRKGHPMSIAKTELKNFFEKSMICFSIASVSWLHIQW